MTGTADRDKIVARAAELAAADGWEVDALVKCAETGATVGDEAMFKAAWHRYLWRARTELEGHRA